MRFKDGDIVRAIKTYKELEKDRLYRISEIIFIDSVVALKVKPLDYCACVSFYFSDKFEFVRRDKLLPAGTKVVYRRPEADSYHGGSRRAIQANVLTLNRRYVLADNQRDPEVIRVKSNNGDAYKIHIDSVDIIKERLPKWF